MADIFPKIYPFRSALVAPDQLSKEPFHEPPVGIVVHYTAERGMQNIRSALVASGLCYHLIIGRDGKVEQHAWLDHVVWHAGKALWRGMSPNHRFLAVALESWGEVKCEDEPQDGFTSWTGADVPSDDVVARPGNIQKATSFWDAATERQLAALDDLCLWACAQGIDPLNICGHDECALPLGRKIDPGGVLPMGMEDFRKSVAVARGKNLV